LKSKWTKLAVLYVSAVSISIGQLKIVPIMESLAALAGVSIAQAGLLVSVFTGAGIILAIPSGSIMAKLGSKKLLLTLMTALCAGNILGAVSDNFVVLVISRLIEGTAFAMIIMVGLMLINTWFQESGKGIATGIFTTFPAVGSFTALNITLPVVQVLGVKSMWWLTGIIAALCFLLILIVIKTPEENTGIKSTEKRPLLSGAAKNPKLWLFACCHFCIAFLLFSYITTYPVLFSGFYGIEAGLANFYSSLNGLSGVPACILVGILIEKTKKPRMLALVGCIGAAITAAFNLKLGPYTYPLHSILSSLFIGGFALTANFCIGPQLARSPEYLAYTMAFINLLYYGGVFASTPVILSVVEKAGWQSATILMVCVALVAALCMTALLYSEKPRQPKRLAKVGEF
jgi:predicted MFS family arabinose efflux permease